MLKMMKYEYRRGLFPLIVIMVVLGMAELLFLAGVVMDRENMLAIGMAGLIFGSVIAYLFVLIYGIFVYNEDLKNKTGYLVFMTPISSYRIIGAKLLSILLNGVTLVLILVALAGVDIALLLHMYEDPVALKELLNAISQSLFQVSAGTVFLNVATAVLVMLIQFFTTITIAFFAITLASTVLQNKKVKGVISFVLFIVINMLMSYVAEKLPTIGNVEHVNSMLEALGCVLPQILFMVVVMVASYFASGCLLEKKVSL